MSSIRNSVIEINESAVNVTRLVFCFKISRSSLVILMTMIVLLMLSVNPPLRRKLSSEVEPSWSVTAVTSKVRLLTVSEKKRVRVDASKSRLNASSSGRTVSSL